MALGDLGMPTEPIAAPGGVEAVDFWRPLASRGRRRGYGTGRNLDARRSALVPSSRWLQVDHENVVDAEETFLMSKQHQQSKRPLSLHEIQRMFEEMGLGTEGQRAIYQYSHQPESPSDQEPREMVFIRTGSVTVALGRAIGESIIEHVASTRDDFGIQ